MKLPKILPSAALLGAVILSLAGAPRSSAQTTSAATDPVGFTSTALLANSDSRISIPFTRPSVFSGTISSISGSTITVAASPGWATDQYTYLVNTRPNTYYAIIGPNFAMVTGTVSATNGSTAVTGTGSVFTQMVAGDEIVINGTAATVASVTSATALTLVSPFIGATVAGTSATFDHSLKEGSYYTVTSNGSNTLTVNLNGDSLASIAGSLGNTTVTLIPYWTLGTTFPASDSGVSYTDSTSTSPRNRATQILLPDVVSQGTDLAPTTIYYHYNGNWRLAGAPDATVSYDDVILPPTNYLTVRNTASATTFTPSGGVYMNRISIPLATESTTRQDNAVTVPRPTNVTLNDLGLIASGAFTVSTSTSPRSRADTLLVFDNSTPGVDKSASNIYYYYQGGWRLAGATDITVDYGSTVIPYGTGFTIQKAVTTTGTTAFWQNTRNY